MQQQVFGSLDGLRCLSIVAVVFHHALSHTLSGPLAVAGMEGVSLFFVISGFLITTLLLREQDRHGTLSLRNFYARRALRIFPLYYAVLALYVLVVTFAERDLAVKQAFYGNLPAFLTYTSNWFIAFAPHGGRVVFYFAWSLATEEQFYMVWPPLLRKLRKHAVWAIIAIFLSVEGLRMLVRGGVVPFGGLWMRIMLSVAPTICLGVLLAFVLHSPRGFARLYRWVGWKGASPLFFALTLLAGVTGAPHALLYLFMAALVASCVIREDHPLAHVLSLAPLRSMGLVSYGMYLLHMLVLNVVRRGLDYAGVSQPLVLFAATVLLAWGAAWVSYHGFERRFLALKHRFSR